MHVAAPISTQFKPEAIRKDFPILETLVHGKPLVYLDNAASTQKPKAVVDALERFYLSGYSNVHRGVHHLSQLATNEFEASRSKVRAFINAAEDREIIFVRGATEGINLVARCYGRDHIKEGDEVIVSEMEHHANIVPWQMICEEKGATLRVIPINDRGELLLDQFETMLSEKTKIVAVGHVSNALGTVNPVKEIIAMAHRWGVPVLVDGAQSTPHLPIDVRELDCDFFVFSGHKVYGPTGIGVLYGKAEWLEAMPPYQGGGDMILSVSFEKTIYNEIPFKFEAGTPDIAGAIGLGAALDYLTALPMAEAAAHETELLRYATQLVSEISEVTIIGTAAEKASVLSFVLCAVHPHDIGTILDQEGVAVRAGHHCAQPVMRRFGIPATARASFALYNTREDVHRLVAAIKRVIEVFN